MGSGGHTIKPRPHRSTSPPQPTCEHLAAAPCALTAALVPSIALCSVSFSEPEGYIDSNDFPPQPLGSFLECTYNVTVYTGYGVELQVARSWWPLLSHLLFSSQGYFGWFYRVGPPASACPTEVCRHGDSMLAKRRMRYPGRKSLNTLRIKYKQAPHTKPMYMCAHGYTVHPSTPYNTESISNHQVPGEGGVPRSAAPVRTEKA